MSNRQVLRRMLDDEVDRVARRTADCVVQERQADVPYRDGNVRRSIRSDGPDRRGMTVTFSVLSDPGIAPHGIILDRATGKTITPKRADALRWDGPSGPVFAKSVRQSTKHRGWWSDWPWAQYFAACAQRATVR